MKSLVRFFLVVAALALAPMQFATAGPITVGNWVGFCFADGGPATVGCLNEAAETSGNPFTFVAVGDRTILQVTDAFNQGDMFSVFDFGVLLFTTSVVPNSGTNFGITNPDAAFADPRYSHGAIVLAAGNHSITVFNVQGCCGGGGAYLRAVVPEPESLALVAIAMVGIAVTRRRKQR